MWEEPVNTREVLKGVGFKVHQEAGLTLPYAFPNFNPTDSGRYISACLGDKL